MRWRTAVLIVASACYWSGATWAQFTLPPAAPPLTGKALFAQQCGTCHTLSSAEPIRQGPPLGGVIGRRAGSVPGFHYSPGFAKAGFTWDQAHLDSWLSDPQAVVPGAVMLYHQADPEKRLQIIEFLSTGKQ
jgi:cytochrome c